MLFRSSGINLLGPEAKSLNENIAIHENYLFSKNGVVAIINGQKKYFKWNDPVGFTSMKTSISEDNLDQMFRSYTGYKASVGFFIQKEIHQSRSKP